MITRRNWIDNLCKRKLFGPQSVVLLVKPSLEDHVIKSRNDASMGRANCWSFATSSQLKACKYL